MGCDEPEATALPGPEGRPGDRGPHRILHRIGPDILSWRCPRAYANEPIAIEAWDAFLWWDKGQELTQLTAPYPVPAILITAVRVVRNEYRRAHDEHWERHRPQHDR